MRRAAIVIGLSMFVAAPASGQVKQWVDEGGTIHLGDDARTPARGDSTGGIQAEPSGSVPVLTQSCTISAIAVRGFNVEFKDPCTTTSCPRLKITGELINGCAKPVGIQIQVIARNDAGQVIDVMEAWPASVRNIPAGGSYPFSISGLMDYDARMKRFAIRIIEVRQW